MECCEITFCIIFVIFYLDLHMWSEHIPRPWDPTSSREIINSQTNKTFYQQNKRRVFRTISLCCVGP